MSVYSLVWAFFTEFKSEYLAYSFLFSLAPPCCWNSGGSANGSDFETIPCASTCDGSLSDQSGISSIYIGGNVGYRICCGVFNRLDLPNSCWLNADGNCTCWRNKFAFTRCQPEVRNMSKIEVITQNFAFVFIFQP